MPPLVVIVGETASGKSALAMEIAEKFNGEIICADSWTVYKDFDIGTAKPSPGDLERVPHHLLDVADPNVGFSAAVFQRLANESIREVVQRHKLPILAGGTGLYIDSVIFDYGFLPPSDPDLHRELNALSLSEVVDRAETLGLDLSVVDVRNKRRVIRLIENGGKLPTKQELRPNTLVLGLALQRDHLKQRIEARVDAMLAAGLEGEVSRLAKKYGWDAEPMKGIGYREWHDYFDGAQTIEETKQKIIKATADLAKKQRTWFRRNKSIQWVSDRSTAVEIVTTFLNK